MQSEGEREIRKKCREIGQRREKREMERKEKGEEREGGKRRKERIFRNFRKICVLEDANVLLHTLQLNCNLMEKYTDQA